MAVSFVSTEPDAELEEVLYLSLGVELSNFGYSSVRSGREPRGGREAPYLLAAAYTLRGTEADVALSLTGGEQAGTELSAEEFILHLDISFDADVADGLKRLLEVIPGEAPKENAAAPEIGGVFESELVTVKSMMRTDKKVRLETFFSGGAAPFLGEFSGYSAYGAFASAQAGVLFLKPAWSISAGARFSLARAFMAEGVSGGTVYLSSGAANFQLGLGAAQKLKLAVCASGGGAVLTLESDGDYLSKLVPYADAGVLVGFTLARDLFLGGDIRFFSAFDRDITILGTAAAMTICKEF